MTSVVVCGAGPVGLALALMLNRDGHEVTVLDADPEAPPDGAGAAWTGWGRSGVAQFRQPHNLLTRFRHVCDAELPGMTQRLLDAGCVWVDYLDSPPPTLSDRRPRPGGDLRFVTGRRPVVEAVFAAAAQEQPGVDVRRGVRVTGLRAGPSALPGTPHVTGVHTADGEEIAADLVVDATGRRTRSVAWLAELGARPPQVESEDSGFVYYTRYFTGTTQPRRRGRALCPMGSFSILTLDGDNDTWSVTLYTASGDPALKGMRHVDAFTRIVQACPLQAHWLGGTPITDVLAMAGITDRYHRLAVDGAPVVTGFAAVGDAWACTNPSAGRGLSVGLLHAQVLRGVVRRHLDDPAALARACDEQPERVVAPFYRNQVAADRARLAEMSALRNGAAPTPSDTPMARLLRAAAWDADAFRGVIETVVCVALPEDVLGRPAVAAALEAYGGQAPPPVPGPDRRQLLDLIAG